MKNRWQDGANWIFTAIFALQFGCSFMTQEIYSATNRYASLIAFFALAVLFLGNVSIREVLKKKDVEWIVMCVTDVAALLFLFLIQSHKGAILTVVNLLLVLYMADKVQFSNLQVFCMTLCGGLLFIPWFGLVKWDYNYNMVGLIFLVVVILGLLLLQRIKERFGMIYLTCVQYLLYVTGVLFTILYHSRCAVVGMLIFGIVFLADQKICGHKIVYKLMTFFATVGSVLFTLIYVLLGRSGISLVILYKDILSGREDIWGELWESFLRQPFTGIGSAYQMKTFFIFEVHNGLFDILVVHGILVFAVVLWFLIRRLLQCTSEGTGSMIQRIARAGVFAVLFTSFFENFVIVPPYLLVFFLLMTLLSPKRHITCTNQ